MTEIIILTSGKMSLRYTQDVIGRNAQNYRYIGRNAQNLKKLVRTSSSTLSLLELLSEQTKAGKPFPKQNFLPEVPETV